MLSFVCLFFFNLFFLLKYKYYLEVEQQKTWQICKLREQPLELGEGKHTCIEIDNICKVYKTCHVLL